MAERRLVGGIELGGTKTLVAVGHDDGTILKQTRFPTTAPKQVVDEIVGFLRREALALGPLTGVGVGAFGPIVLDPKVGNFGTLLDTNKPGWSGFDLAFALKSALGLTPTILTDVGAAGVGEARLGGLRGIDLGVYLTVGTGIGGAILCRGQPLPALLHPEMGHIALVRATGDTAPSTCQFHKNCAEGLAAGPAIKARFGEPLSAFAPYSTQHALVADYLGQVCANLVLTLSPQRIILGGGVFKAEALIEQTHAAMTRHLNGYATRGTMDGGFLSAPILGEYAGIVGALCAAAHTAKGICEAV